MSRYWRWIPVVLTAALLCIAASEPYRAAAHIFVPKVPQFIATSGSCTWQTIYSATMSTNDSLSNATGRTVFLAASLSSFTGTASQLRPTFTAGASNLSFTKAYVGHRAGAGDTYDFAATPVQLTDSGSTSITVVGTELLDAVNFAYNGTSGLVFSYYSAGSMTYKKLTTATNVGGYYLAGSDDAVTVDTTGYTTEGTSLNRGISKIEVCAG